MAPSPGTHKRRTFQEHQHAFTRHIRDPQHTDAPSEIEDRRMGIYRDLLYNNVQKFLANSYPVLRKIHSDEAWHALMRSYFREHRARTPLFPKMPQEFLHYLENERGTQPGDYPFLVELARYEWAEIAVSIDSREIDMTGIDPEGDLLAGVPVLSPLAFPAAYDFPVHRISPEFLPQAAPEQPTYLIVYRDRADKVGFLELNPVTARLVELLQDNSHDTGADILKRIAGELQHPDPPVVIQGGLNALREMHQRDVVLGVRA